MRPLWLMLVCFCGGLAVLQAQGEGLRVIVVDGDEAANIVAERIAAEPVVEVRDRNNRRVAGAVVRFVIRRTGRNLLPASFRNGQAEERSLTDGAGRARTGALTPREIGPFEIDVEVSYQGQTASTTLRHTNYSTAAEARAAGRQPGQSSGSTAATAGAATAAGVAAAGGAAAGGGGMSALAIVGLAAGGAAGAGAAVVLSQKESAPPRPPGRVVLITPSAVNGIASATPFTFSAQVADFGADSLTYRWEFGDGATSAEATPTHVYGAGGRYTVVASVSDGRQTARSETTVTVVSLTGTWRNTAIGDTLLLTQSGSDVAGVGDYPRTWVPTNTPLRYINCAVKGTVQVGTPSVTLSQPRCIDSLGSPIFLSAVEFHLDLGSDGRTLQGTGTSEFGGTFPTTWTQP